MSGAVRSDFVPHVVQVGDRPILVMTPWEAVLTLFEVRAAHLDEGGDLLTQLQILAIRCALGLVDRAQAHQFATRAAADRPDVACINQWLDLYIDTYLTRSDALATARDLLAHGKV